MLYKCEIWNLQGSWITKISCLKSCEAQKERVFFVKIVFNNQSASFFVVTKAGCNCCKLPFKVRDEKYKKLLRTISVQLVAVLSELGGMFTLKEEPSTAKKAKKERVFLLCSRLAVPRCCPTGGVVRSLWPLTPMRSL